MLMLLDQRPHFQEPPHTADTWKIQVSRYRGTESKTKPRRREVGHSRATPRTTRRRERRRTVGSRLLPNSCQALLDRRAKLPVCVHSSHYPEVSGFGVEAKEKRKKKITIV